MCGPENRTQLPLASSGAGCSCCHAEAPSVPDHAFHATGTAKFAVEGLTCGHCVQSVEEAVAAVNGVASVSVELVPGGRSRLVVGGSADSDAVRHAVTSAGYTLISH